jgi:dinuclear metal center YbgI/SA1388 family protein
MDRTALINYMDTYLRIAEVKDFGLQGLQVETENDTVTRIALGVDTSPAIIEAAAEWQADMLIVHHGVLWGKEQRIAGPLGKRVRLLMKHGINLYSAHLPLDAHPEVGNNAVLAKMFGVQVDGWWCEALNAPLGTVGAVAPDTTLLDLERRIAEQLHVPTRTLAYGPQTVSRVAILSGYGADQITEAQATGADTFITGETSHAHYWAAADYGMNVIFAGHYATETVGVIALGEHLASKFNLQVKFLDFPTQM